MKTFVGLAVLCRPGALGASPWEIAAAMCRCSEAPMPRVLTWTRKIREVCRCTSPCNRCIKADTFIRIWWVIFRQWREFFWHKKRGDTFQGWSVLCFFFCLSFILLIFVSLSLSLRWPVCSFFISFFLSFVLYFFMCSLFFQCSFTILPLLSLFYYIWYPFLCLFTFFSFSFLPFTFPCSFVFLSPAWNGINLHCLGRQEAVQECIAVSANGSKILFGENLWLTLCQKQWERFVSLIGCASLYPYTVLHRS